MIDLDLTTEAGREDACRRVALAMGWIFSPCVDNPRLAFWFREGNESLAGEAPPDYLSDDPRLNREMLVALRASLGEDEQVRIEYGPDWFLLSLLTDAPALFEWGSHRTKHTEAAALVLALDAAGLLDEED